VRRIVWFLFLASCHSDTPAQSEQDAIAWAETSHSAAAQDTPSDPPSASGPFYEPDPDGHPVAILRGDAPNMHYAAMDTTACEGELRKRSIGFIKAPAMKDVHDPLRLNAPLHGIAVHTAPGPSEIFDCRLVLAVDDFAAQLAKHDITEILAFGAYRPQKQNGCTAKYAGLQHCGGLALDIGSFKKKDGSTLVVDKEFNGKIGQSTCGGAHPKPVTPAATELWSYVCDAASQAIFNVILTPNHNKEHHNHFHVEVTPDAEWMLIK
jgi:hypothetical protein